jgi:hypothetical protein
MAFLVCVLLSDPGLRDVDVYDVLMSFVIFVFRARDIPEKAGGIEIYNCFDYQTMRLHWQGSGLLLHELCHLIHQFTLPNGLENATVIEAFERATKGGLYDRTLRCAPVSQVSR